MIIDSSDKLQKIGFRGFYTIADLTNKLDYVPNNKGVFVVLNLYKTKGEFLEKGTGAVFKGRNPNAEIKKLQLRWREDAIVLCISQAGSDFEATTLRRQIKRFIMFGNGQPTGSFFCGRYIWQISNAKELVIAWIVLPDERKCSELCFKLKNEFVIMYRQTPFASSDRGFYFLPDGGNASRFRAL
jgi:hypothetical protein